VQAKANGNGNGNGADEVSGRYSKGKGEGSR
jgi:hypothetical protein